MSVTTLYRVGFIDYRCHTCGLVWHERYGPDCLNGCNRPQPTSIPLTNPERFANDTRIHLGCGMKGIDGKRAYLTIMCCYEVDIIDLPVKETADIRKVTCPDCRARYNFLHGPAMVNFRKDLLRRTPGTPRPR